MPTLRQLEYFVAVAEQRHFGRAAQDCNISQPTLSHQIRALEDRLGATLIDRTTSKAELTPIGREVYERARKVLMGVRDIRALTARSAKQFSGIVRFGITPTLGPYLMPALIGALKVDLPELRFYIREGIPAEQAKDLSLGRLDLVVGPGPMAGENLEVMHLFDEPMSIVASPNHHLADAGQVTRADLAGERFLTLDPRHHYHQLVGQACAELGAEILLDYEGTSLDSVHHMAGSGVGLAILPELYLRSEVGGDALVVRLPIDEWQCSRTIVAAWRADSANAGDYRALSYQIKDKAERLLSY